MNSLVKMLKIDGLSKEIVEHKQIIGRYMNYGVIDRDDVIRRIIRLRQNETKVREVYVASCLVNNGITLQDETNDQLIKELELQVCILEEELAELGM